MKTYLFIVYLCLFGIGGTSLFPTEVIKDISWGNGYLMFDLQDNMYLGYNAHSISKYSPRGELLLKIGRKGEGPGDIKRMSHYAFNPQDNALYVTEFYNGNRWISRFSTDGKFIGDWKFEFDWLKYNVVSDIAFDTEGNVFVIARKRKPRRYRDYMVTNELYELRKYSPGGKFLRTVYSFNTDFDAEKPGYSQVTIPFQNTLTWSICQGKIVIKETSGSVIQVFSTDGKLEKKIPFPLKSEKVTGRDIDAWEKILKSQPFIKAMGADEIANYWRKNLVFPEYKPNSAWIFNADSKGNLYLREYTQYSEKENPDWVKVNCQTGKVDIFKLKPGETLLGVRGDQFFLYKAMEDNDNEIGMLIKLDETELFNR